MPARASTSTRSKKKSLGRQMAQEVERQAKIVDDPIISEYVNRIGQNLVRNSDAKVPFTIKVIGSDEINAFALPGGFFFVNTGILLNADNPRNSSCQSGLNKEMVGTVGDGRRKGPDKDSPFG
jgi:predicted Zn-dependent protease